jgi:hypothetical protein
MVIKSNRLGPFFRSEWNFILTICSFALRVNNSLKIYFSETIIPRKLILCSNVPWVGLFKICSQGSEIPNIFRTGSEKPQKLAKSLKIFYSRTVGATGFSSLFEATSCDRHFSDYASEGAKVWKITISMLNNYFAIGFRAKKSIASI